MLLVWQLCSIAEAVAEKDVFSTEFAKRSIVVSALSSTPRSPYPGELSDGKVRAPCLFAGCKWLGRNGVVRLEHALRDHRDEVLGDGHCVALSRGYESYASAELAFHGYSASSAVGIEWRQLSKNDTCSVWQCPGVPTRRGDVQALDFTARTAAAVDAATAPARTGDTTATLVFSRKTLREVGGGHVPSIAHAGCAARGKIFSADGLWHWEMVSIHTHALDSPHICGDILAARAKEFVKTTGGRGNSTLLSQQLVREGYHVSMPVVAVAVSRAGAAHKPGDVPRSIPSALSVLRYLNTDVVSGFFIAACLAGSSSITVQRAVRPPDDFSRGAAAAHWHQSDVDASGTSITTVAGTLFCNISCEKGLRRIADAEELFYDTSFKYVLKSREMSLGVIVTTDPDTQISVPGMVMVLADGSVATLVAALDALRRALEQRKLAMQARVLVQDNQYRDFAAFCFVFGSFLWRHICLVSISGQNAHFVYILYISPTGAESYTFGTETYISRISPLTRSPNLPPVSLSLFLPFLSSGTSL